MQIHKICNKEIALGRYSGERKMPEYRDEVGRLAGCRDKAGRSCGGREDAARVQGGQLYVQIDKKSYAPIDLFPYKAGVQFWDST